MIDQLIIGDKASFDDFCASVAKRKIGLPSKKKITDEVPFSNDIYDFSKINGEIFWNARPLEYTLEMTAETAEKLEDMKTALSDWLMNIYEETLKDSVVDGYHFIATFEEIDFEDEETLDKTTAAVKFTAYPYKIADIAKKYAFTLGSYSAVTATINNESSHRIAPTIKTSADITINKGGVNYSISTGETTDYIFTLEKGSNSLIIQNPNTGEITVEITFFEEVF